MYHPHSPKGWDLRYRPVSDSAETRGKRTLVPEVRSPTVRRRELGALLRALRTQKGLTVEQAADKLLCSPSKVSRMETGHGAATPRDIRDLCNLYGVIDQAERDRLMSLARDGKQTGWWQSYELEFSNYVGLEADATELRYYQSTIVPGLLQTADYARAMIEVTIPRLRPERIDELLEVKMKRQLILKGDRPLRLWGILDEAALHRLVGGPAVMAAQLDRLIEVTSNPNITIQVIPYEAGAHPAMDSTFNILGFAGTVPGLVYVEGLVGWIYLDRRNDIERYQKVFEHLHAQALDPRASMKLIAKIGKSYSAYRLAYVLTLSRNLAVAIRAAGNLISSNRI
jgi:transcriptional regulator with XRE-family HTH domain